MKINKFITSTLLIVLCLSVSCKDDAGDRLEERMDDKSDMLDDRSDDLEDAADYVEDGFDDIEEAIENFKNALEEVDNPEDRDAIRKRINQIMDELDMARQ